MRPTRGNPHQAPLATTVSHRFAKSATSAVYHQLQRVQPNNYRHKRLQRIHQKEWPELA